MFEEPPPEPKSLEETQIFVLEKYLQEFIVANFDAVFHGELKLYTDPGGARAEQYPTDVGDIDILARNPATGTYSVIKLKRGRESDRVVGQILRYMGWVKENLCQKDEDVEGVIICERQDERLQYALKMVGNVKAKFYKINFELID